MIIERVEADMLVELLEELEQAFSQREPEEMDEQEYEGQAIYFAEKLSEQVYSLAKAANDEVFTSPAFQESKTHTGFYHKVSPRIAEVVFRPVSPFVDLILRASLYRRCGPNPADVTLSLEISGETIEAFRNFYMRHWVGLEKLLWKSCLQLETESEYESLSKYRGKQVYRQIGLYMSEKELDKSGFSLVAEFDKRRLDHRFKRTFLLLAFIYESTYLSSLVIERMNEVDDYLRATAATATRQMRPSPTPLTSL